jgi:hypothetical protein
VEALEGGGFLYDVLFGVSTTDYSGNATDFIRAISFKDVVTGASNFHLTGAPGGAANWLVVGAGLNTTGCGSGGLGGDGCAAAGFALNGGFGIPVSSAEHFFWRFTFESADETPNATGRIKYLFVTDALNEQSQFAKAGSSGSWDIPLQTHQVPEPSSLLLLGMACGTAAVVRKCISIGDRRRAG